MDGKLFFVPNCCSYNKEYVWQINVSKEFLRSLGAVIHLKKKKKKSSVKELQKATIINVLSPLLS